MSWFARNAATVEAAAAAVTALVAVFALIGVIYQVRAADTLSRAQSARDIYREFVALSVEKPEFAAPDYCTLRADPLRHTAYQFYVEYLLYTAEQSLSNDPEWASVFESHLAAHTAFFCHNPDWTGDIPAVAALIDGARTECQTVETCP